MQAHLPEKLDYATMTPADRFRLTRTENNIVFDNMAFMFQGKAANTSIKAAVLSMGGRLDEGLNIHADPRLRYVATGFLLNRMASYNIIGVVRRPWDRYVSFWRDKIAGRTIHNFSAHYIHGAYPDMPFEDFVVTVLQQLDSNKVQNFLNYFQRFEDRFIKAGVLVPHKLVRYDHLEEDWNKVRMIYPRLPELPHYNKAEKVPLRFKEDDTQAKMQGRVWSHYEHEYSYFGWRRYD